MNKKTKHRRMTREDNPIITAAKRGLRDREFLVILGKWDEQPPEIITQPCPFSIKAQGDCQPSIDPQEACQDCPPGLDKRNVNDSPFVGLLPSKRAD